MGPARFIGTLFLLTFIGNLYVLLLEGYPIYLMWFSNHWALALSIAAFAGSRYWVHALLNIGLIGESIWIIDFVSALLGYGHPFGSTTYMFMPAYPSLMYAGGLAHLVLLPLAFYLFWEWGSDPSSWTASFMYGGALFVASRLFPGHNLNCVQEPCVSILHILPNYAISYPLAMAGVIVLTHLVLLLHKRKNEQ